MVDAIPPHDLDAEAAVLSAILIEGTGQQIDAFGSLLAPEKFYSEAHRQVFEAMLSLHREGAPVDVVTTLARLRTTGRLAQVGGSSYLTDILGAAQHLTNAEGYAKIVDTKWVLRTAITAGHRIAAEGYALEGGAEDVASYLDRSAQTIFDCQQTNAKDRACERIGDVAKRALQAMILRQQNGESSDVEPTGFVDLDEYLVGFQRGRFYVLAARPGVGKTALALNFAMHVARKREASKPKHVIFFSLEMTSDELATRAMSTIGNVDHMRVQKVRLRGNDVGSLTDAVNDMMPVTLHVCDDPNVSLYGMRAAARKIRADIERNGGELALVVVDYLQLIDSPDRRRNETRENEVARLSRGLKKFTKELDCAVLALAQLNRSVEERVGKAARPRLSDLRESGAIEQDANVVMFIHRVDKEDGDKAEAKEHEIIVAKNRGGPTGIVRLMFAANLMAWRALEPNERDDVAADSVLQEANVALKRNLSSQSRHWYEVDD